MPLIRISLVADDGQVIDEAEIGFDELGECQEEFDEMVEDYEPDEGEEGAEGEEDEAEAE